MTATPVKTRFAPSPTGRLHLGNLRTALFNCLLARHHGGEFLLRVEDSDLARNQADGVANLQADLRWLGLEWDEGPGGGQPASEWQQSARGAIHHQAVDQLLESSLAYPCFCSAERLQSLRAEQKKAGLPPRYDGHCAGIPAAVAAARLAAGETASVRLRMPGTGSIGFDDLIRGRQTFSAEALSDPVIRRADGSAAFLLANAVDDAQMGITHVIRGEDHLSNTPRQIVLLESLGLEAPGYGHVGLVVNTDGTPLSKRTGSAGVGELDRQGYRPEAVINYLARLGASIPTDELLSLEALAAKFTVQGLSRGPARFDRAQLDHWQTRAMAHLTADELSDAAAAAGVPADLQGPFTVLVQPNLKTLADINGWAWRLCDPAAEVLDPVATPARDLAVIIDASPTFFLAARDALDACSKSDWSTVRPALEAATGAGGGRLMKPLRLALTGLGHGPTIGEIIEFMPAATRRARLARAAELATTGVTPNA